MARTMTKYESEGEEPINIFHSRENHYPLDQLLRKHGFRIYSRKKDEEAVWERKGGKFKESTALKMIPKRELDEVMRK